MYLIYSRLALVSQVNIRLTQGESTSTDVNIDDVSQLSQNSAQRLDVAGVQSSINLSSMTSDAVVILADLGIDDDPTEL